MPGTDAWPGSSAGHVNYDVRYNDIHYDPAAHATGGPTPGALALAQHWAQTTGLGNMGIYANRPVRGGSALSVHAEGRAVDLSANASNQPQRQIAYNYIAWLIQNARNLGVQYIIFNHYQWKPDRGWTPYRGGVPHTDHVHVELNRTAAANPSPMWKAIPNVRTNNLQEVFASTAGAGGGMGAGMSDWNSNWEQNAATNASGPQPGETVDQYARRAYGYLGWFLDHPEIGPIIRDAATEGLDESRLMGRLFDTNWWKTTSETARLWDVKTASDPASARTDFLARVAEIEDAIGALGIEVSPEKVFQITGESLRFGIDPNSPQFRNTLASLIPGFSSTSKPGAGAFAQTLEEIKRLAKGEYMIGIADSDAWRMAQDVVAGKTTMDGIRASFSQVAQGRFPQLIDTLSKGVTPGQFFAPYKNAIADELEMSADMVDLLDPRFANVLGVADPGGKGVRPMTFSETLKFVRRMPEWQKTDRAKGQSATLARTLAESMGRAVF